MPLTRSAVLSDATAAARCGVQRTQLADTSVLLIRLLAPQLQLLFL
jgi:hypothetical protein